MALTSTRSYEDISKCQNLDKDGSLDNLEVEERLLSTEIQELVKPEMSQNKEYLEPRGLRFTIQDYTGTTSHVTTPVNYAKRRSSIFSLSTERIRRASEGSFLSVKSVNLYIRSHRKVFLYTSVIMAVIIVIFTLCLMFMF